jgi:hypothetical protein
MREQNLSPESKACVIFFGVIPGTARDINGGLFILHVDWIMPDCISAPTAAIFRHATLLIWNVSQSRTGIWNFISHPREK